MFFVNQMMHVVLIQPDWDITMQVAARYITLGASVYLLEMVDILNHLEGLYG